MSAGLCLSGDEAAIVRAILSAHLPQGFRALVFGSRAHGPCKPWSDLDLGIAGQQALDLSVMAALAEAFEESPLPWKVDLVDLGSVSDDFRKLVLNSAIAL